LSDVTLKEFQNSATKDNAWKAVADELGAKGNIQFSRTLGYCWYSFRSFYEEKLLASSQQSCCIFTSVPMRDRFL